MKLKDLAEITRTKIEVRSARSGKILCRDYREKKHPQLSDRAVISVWGEIRADNSGGYRSFAQPVVCVYVSDYPAEQGEQS